MHISTRGSLFYICCLTGLLASCKTTFYHTSSHQAQMISIDSQIEEDTLIVQYIAPFKKQLDAEMSKVIGIAAHALPKSPRDQSLGGNFFAESLLSLGKELDPEVSCALGTKDGIRIDLPEGPITIRHIFELMPFENFLTILTLKGTDILVLGEFIARNNGQPIAGMSIVIHDEKLVEMRVKGELVRPDKIYKLATYDYLANGGDYIQGLSTPIHRMDTPTRVREGLIAHIQSLSKNGQTIHAVIDERIKIIQ